MPVCGLCKNPDVEALVPIRDSYYFTCPTCDLVFLHDNQRPTRGPELARYQEHHNSADNPGYREFLSPVAEELVQRLNIGALGLDFGSGPDSSLPALLKEKGFSVSLYDPFFSPDPELLAKQYDFITCTETVEHFFDPHAEFELLDSLLKDGGWIAIITQFFDDKSTFTESPYRFP